MARALVCVGVGEHWLEMRYSSGGHTEKYVDSVFVSHSSSAHRECSVRWCRALCLRPTAPLDTAKPKPNEREPKSRTLELINTRFIPFC